MVKVLIAVDDDEASHDAVAFARHVVPHDAEILLLNVTRFAWVPYVGPMGGVLVPKVPPDYQAQIDEQGAAVADEAADLFEAAATQVDHGEPGQVICALADEQDVDLIVVGTHDRGRWGRMWFGSVSRHVVDHAPCSVLVVR